MSSNEENFFLHFEFYGYNFAKSQQQLRLKLRTTISASYFKRKGDVSLDRTGVMKLASQAGQSPWEESCDTV
jgi:hypothetical protein